jgi:TonB family protein
MKTWFAAIVIVLVLFSQCFGFELQKTVDIPYPIVDRRAGNEGYGEYVITIDNGNVSRIDILESTGFHRLDNAVIYAVSQWRFIGFDANTVILPVIFRLE